jgi:hypothetical protein
MATVTTASIITKIRGLIKDLQKSTGQNIFEYDSDSSFKLENSRADSSTIIVYVNGTDITDSNWSYNSDTNKVTITSSLTKGDDIIITFSYYEKYSDTEIQSYIEANLTRFTEYQYGKRFYMNSSNEVVTQNGANPTEAEGDVIARITAIDIDPKNVTLRTNDFTIGAEEDESKSEQIRRVMNRFMRDFGTVSFMEDEA